MYLRKKTLKSFVRIYFNLINTMRMKKTNIKKSLKFEKIGI